MADHDTFLQAGTRAADVRRRPAERGAETRAKILDAAEYLFAERGFHGVALRDITGRAGVENALASYHFGTKDHLLAAVVARRADEHRADMVDALDRVVEAARPAAPSNQDIVRAYAGPALDKISRGSGWAAYVKLIVGLQNLDRDDHASLLTNSFFDDTIGRFLDAFRAANPHLPERRVQLAVYFLHGTLIHVLSQGKGFERLVDSPPLLDDQASVLDALAEQFAHGLNGCNSHQAGQTLQDDTA